MNKRGNQSAIVTPRLTRNHNGRFFVEFERQFLIDDAKSVTRLSTKSGSNALEMKLCLNDTVYITLYTE